jgi:putative Ca2+/H+ antiporter (TMEM165/GDT1 family)
VSGVSVGTFLLIYAVIGGLELTDRTNFALIGFAARHPPLPTWAGAAAAFVATSALAVAIGAALVGVLHNEILYLRLGGGLLLLGYAGYLWWTPEEERKVPGARSAAVAAFILIFLLELGDTTMIFLATFVFLTPDPLLVFAAGALALSTVAASASVIGSKLGARVEPRVLDRVVVGILLVVGVVTILYALYPGAFPSLG